MNLEGMPTPSGPNPSLQDQVYQLAARVNVLEECLEAVHQRLHWYFECRDRCMQEPTLQGLCDTLKDVVEQLRCDLLVRVDQVDDVAEG